jgi:hypothetical protein
MFPLSYRKIFAAYQNKRAHSDGGYTFIVSYRPLEFSLFVCGEPTMRGLLVAWTISAALAFLSTPALADIITSDEDQHRFAVTPSDVVSGTLLICESPLLPQFLPGCPPPDARPSDTVLFGSALTGSSSAFFIKSDPDVLPMLESDGFFGNGADGFIGIGCQNPGILPCKTIQETADANGTKTMAYTPRNPRRTVVPG